VLECIIGSRSSAALKRMSLPSEGGEGVLRSRRATPASTLLMMVGQEDDCLRTAGGRFEGSVQIEEDVEKVGW